MVTLYGGQRRTAGRGSSGALDQRSGADRRADERRGGDVGLSAEEAAARLARYGRNTLDGKRHSAVRGLLSHFWQPIPWGIEAALVLTALTRRWTESPSCGAS
jgi:H+-transporting ATPase